MTTSIRLSENRAPLVGDRGNQCNSWFAVYTRPRQEHTALLNLERQGFECYLPVVNGREPLFPRYLFLSAEPKLQSMAVVRSTRGVVGLVRAGCDLIKIPLLVIEGLKTRLQRAANMDALDCAGLNDGDKVRVFDGPFAALEGVFKENRGPTRSFLLLEILGRETSVEVDPLLLHRVS
jgi:transcriptional antiterminator RfaH